MPTHTLTDATLTLAPLTPVATTCAHELSGKCGRAMRPSAPVTRARDYVPRLGYYVEEECRREVVVSCHVTR
jgi:hypothetical protein